MTAPCTDCNILFLETQCSSNSNNTLHTLVYRKLTHTNQYLDWNSSHPISAKKAVTHALIHIAKNVCFTPEILAEEMDYLHIALKNKHPDWMIKESEKKAATLIINPVTGFEIKKKHLHICSLFLASVRNMKNLSTYQCTGHVRRVNILKSILMYPEDKILSQRNKTLSTNGPAQKKIATFLTQENLADVLKIE